tara:strand:+ start:1351 stop:2277 length:927 start_codon:yes stop_codon:yes gene_type:complete
MQFTLSHRYNTPVLRFDKPLKVGESARLLVMSDIHHDNVHCDRGLFRRHLAQAVETQTPIVFIGDQMCLMNGRADPRRAGAANVRPEHVGRSNYIDLVVRDFANEIIDAGAAPLVVLMGMGNHEASIRGHLEVDVLERVGERLRQAGSPVHIGGIGGWLLVQLKISKTARTSVPIFYHHGHGGGGMSRGTGHVNKRALYVPDAKVILSGHVHEEFTMTLCRDRICPKTGRQFRDECFALQTATYKQEYDQAGTSWHCLQGRPPKPLGGAFLSLTLAKEYGNEYTAGKGGAKNSRLPRYHVVANAERAK